ncbi:ATP-binding protein [Chamaesiphon sp. VAR_48_metabat_403]|uniref:ATP-binding protein n=1 Tax=Chamaesiphon sp. VAR_48_metabat_403 TaxID=2964700 RepID=UPI00286E9C8D|nr:ATP-binding protein [Chamaesiphon sp. VAR_48_metabat_403]
MTDDLDFQESLDRYFEIEAAELLQTIEQTLLSLVEEKTIERVHTLMRAAHTIKGSAANCGFKTIETIAHHLEDVFQALYPPELEIDPELGLLLMEGYDCLYDPLSALLAKVPYDEAATLERTATLFARLQTHLGDFFGRETPLPTAAELGFDVIGSIFTDSIPHDLEDLAAAIASQQDNKVSESLRSLAEFLLELGGSYSLPGIAAIATSTLSALESHPARVLQLAPIALANFQQAQIAIAGGDRSIGGEVSAELAAWGGGSAPDTHGSSRSNQADTSADWLSLVEPTGFTNIGDPAAEVITNNSDSLEWLSLVDDEPSVDRSTSISSNGETSEWLSLVDDEPIAESLEPNENNAAASSEWLSLVDDETIANPPVSTEDRDETVSATEWLALSDDETIADPPVTTDRNDAVSSEWLSLVDDENIDATIIDLEPEIVEIGTFEPELAGSSSKIEPTLYPIAARETQASTELAIVTKSGLDRIFQSISLDNLAPMGESPESSSDRPPAEREAQPDLSVSVRVATVQLERLSHTIGELLIDDNQQDLRAQQLQKLARSTVEQYRRCEQKLRLVSSWADKHAAIDDRQKAESRRTKSIKKRSKSGKKTTNSQVKSQFDSLELDVYSELSILLQNLTDDLAELGTQVGNLAEMTQRSRLTMHKRRQLLAEAQSELFEARMVEIAGVLNRFPRLLQQMVASHRKPARLELIGSEVSIDKIIAEKLYDPLLHLVRNAYDHGIEPPEQRALHGKSETGQLTIRVYHQGNRTKIEVSDDGQGLNWDRIRNRAIDLNLLAAATANNASEAELAEIMFAPGFSTAEKVNDLSGRGIGLDVVRDRIGALQGTIDVRSVAGKGTTFTMQFPLNLTTTRLMICESEGFVHALRSDAIVQVLIPTPDRIQSQALQSDRATNFLRLGEGSDRKLIPIYPVSSLIDYHCPIVADRQDVTSLFPVKAKNSTNALLLLEIDNEQICLEVSRILVEQELVVKSLGTTFGLPSYIQGYSVLGDGSLTLALDPIELLARVRTNATATQPLAAKKVAALPGNIQAVLPPAADTTLPDEVAKTIDQLNNRTIPQAGRQLQVLVVDDSLVQRQSLARSLTKAGCQVIKASHGREGILRLQEHP